MLQQTEREKVTTELQRLGFTQLEHGEMLKDLFTGARFTPEDPNIGESEIQGLFGFSNFAGSEQTVAMSRDGRVWLARDAHDLVPLGFIKGAFDFDTEGPRTLH